MIEYKQIGNTTYFTDDNWKTCKAGIETQSKNKQIKDSILYFNNWIMDDLKELNEDTKSDYALFILDKHRHINVAISAMEDVLNKA